MGEQSLTSVCGYVAQWLCVRVQMVVTGRTQDRVIRGLRSGNGFYPIHAIKLRIWQFVDSM